MKQNMCVIFVGFWFKSGSVLNRKPEPEEVAGSRAVAYNVRFNKTFFFSYKRFKKKTSYVLCPKDN